MKKIVKTTLVLILTMLMLFAFVGCYNSEEPPTVTPQFYKQWQSYIKGETLIKELIIPGSHDAATKGMMFLGETQSFDILSQLNDGVRFFDLRVALKNNEMYIFHSIVKGMKFSKVVDDIKTFITANPSEVLVLYFQHFENNPMEKMLALMETELNLNNTAVKSATDIATVDMNYMRQNNKNYIVSWGIDDLCGKDYLYPKDDVLTSPYDSDEYKKDVDYFIGTVLPHNYSIMKEDKIFILQSQFTAKSLLGKPIDRENELNKAMTAFTKNIKNDEIILGKTNIIMRDFINVGLEKINAILNLNIAKQTVAEQHITLFNDQTK